MYCQMFSNEFLKLLNDDQTSSFQSSGYQRQMSLLRQSRIASRNKFKEENLIKDEIYQLMRIKR